MLAATLIAVAISLTEAHDKVPALIICILTLLGGMTLPLLMIILGGNIYMDFQKKGHLQLREITKFVIIKNFLFPLVFLGIVVLVRPAYHIALIILLQAAVPTVTAVPIVAERSRGNRAITNQFLVASFILSLISIPVMVSLFSMFFTPP